MQGLSSWRLDVKLGARMLAKHPGLALVGGFGIAIGVAIASGGFSVIHGSFLDARLPLEDSARLISIEVWDASASRFERRLAHDYDAWRRTLRSASELAAFREFTPSLIAPGLKPESVRAAAITASGLEAARVRPLSGRLLTPDDERDGAPLVAVIGERLWRTRFASDPAILRKTVQLGGAVHSIVGVMPEGFAFPVNQEAWTPLRASAEGPLEGPDLQVFGRLAPDATIAAANAEMEAIVRREAAASPRTHRHLRPRVLPYAYPFAGLHSTDDAAGLSLMQSLLNSILVLVCLNVAVVVYSRTAARIPEISLRAALGASRARIVAQLFVEALVLSTSSAAVGVLIAAAALRLLEDAASHVSTALPYWMSFRLRPEAVLYAAGLSVLAAAIVGIVPALQATRRDTISGVGVRASEGPQLGSLWTLLIVAQTAFVVAILPASLSNAWADLRDGFANPGFGAERFLTARIGSDGARASSRAELSRRLESDPAVSAITHASAIPGDEPGARIEVEGMAEQPREVRVNRVDLSFFPVFEVPVLAGRGLQASDIAPVDHQTASAVVNQAFAQTVFAGQALGRRFRYSSAGEAEPGRWIEITGIVPDFPPGVSAGMRDTPLRIYHASSAEKLPVLMVRTRGAGAAFAGPFRDLAASVDPGLQTSQILPLDEALRRDQWIWRAQAAVLGCITASVLALSAAGIYALVSFTVTRRRKEIGIRTALGASRERIVAGVFSRTLYQLGAGAAVGAVGAAAIEYGLGLSRDGIGSVLPVAVILVLAVGVPAALGPARRGLRIEPSQALRE